MANQPLRSQEPFQVALEGGMPDPDGDLSDGGNWPNSISVQVVSGCAAQVLEGGEGYADSGTWRELVQIDTNYKSSRTSEYPVRLSRPDAVALAAHVLTAVEDTFHYVRCGQLRAAEAAELLQALTAVDDALRDLREHALQDLIDDTGAENDTKTGAQA